MRKREESGCWEFRITQLEKVIRQLGFRWCAECIEWVKVDMVGENEIEICPYCYGNID